MPMPTDIKQLLSLLGGLSYYLKLPPNMAKRARPITALLKKEPRSASLPPWKKPFASFSGNSQLHRYMPFLNGTLLLTSLDRSACIAMPAPLASEQRSNRNSPTALSAPSSILVEQPPPMSGTGFQWNSKPDASCGVLDVLAAIYLVCSS